ncbi:MAG: SUMF1/EgtB/PvdO family nonheme iron enzyme [Alistipes sp.]|nr:SUMF1/EgtB/PvdO family nonheme iron enzyme [Alistipes sp.]
MKQLNYLLVVLAATLYLGCTPPERVDNGGNNSDDIENNGGSENNGGGGNGNDGNGNNGGAENTSKPTTSAPYEVGDYYNESGKEGIVIEVDQDGNNGKIISLRQSSSPLQWASDVAEQNRLVGTIYMSGGVENLAKIVKIPNWKEKYPAFKWCFDYGKGWYLPALQEVESFSTHRDVINSALSAAGGTPIGVYSYWSSTEDSASAENGEYKAHYVNVNTKTSLSNQKKYKFYVRAVASFGDWYDEIYNDIYQEIYDNPNDDDNGGDDNGGGSGGGDDDNNGDGDDDNNGDGGGNNPNDPITVINGIEMVAVNGGTFTMGSDDAEALDTERPAHSVTVSDYFIGKYEVTQALWVAVMGSNPSGFRGDDNLPVENISWNMAMEFITKLNAITGKRYRMPTEAEWELAAREALLTQKYPYSGSYNVDEVAWYCDNAENMTHPVGQKKPNPRGIYDMSGNVFELCYDWFGMYSTAHQTNPIGPSSGTFRIIRGGSYVDNAFGCRIIYRNGLDSQDARYINVGLRLAMSADVTGPDYNDRDWLGPDFYNPINPNPDPDNPNPNPDDPDPDNPDDGTPGGGGSFIGVTKGPYKRGDYYNDGEKEGIVFYLDNDVDEGMHGQIVSLIQSETPLQWTSYYNYQCSYVIPNYVDNYGDEIMAYIKKISNWQTKFPAFAWCATLGDNWYLMDGFAAVRLIGNLWHEGTYEVVNKTLEEKNATKLFNKGEHYEYWLAGEVSEFDASYYDMYTDGVRYGSSFNKSDYKYVRAVAKF